MSEVKIMPRMSNVDRLDAYVAQRHGGCMTPKQNRRYCRKGARLLFVGKTYNRELKKPTAYEVFLDEMAKLSEKSDG